MGSAETTHMSNRSMKTAVRKQNCSSVDTSAVLAHEVTVKLQIVL